MKLIVDSNIIFSALLKTRSTFGQIIFNSSEIFEFYSPNRMRTEIRSHWNKLKKISNLSDDQLETSFNSLLSKISFINEELISQKIWEDSEKILHEVDLDDIDFVALTKSIKGKLWTGDKVLYHGLKNNGFRNVLTTADVLKIWLRKKKVNK